MPTGFFYGDLPPSLQSSYEADPRNAITQQLLQNGTSQTPLRGGVTEGVLRLANALLGGYNQRKLGQEYQHKGTDYNAALAAALQGVKPGHYDESGQYVPTDTSSIDAAAAQNPALTSLAQQFQLARLKGGIAADADVAAARAKNQYADWRDPAYQDFQLRRAQAGAEALNPYRMAQLGIAQGQLGVAQENAATNRLNAGNRAPIEVADPNSPTGRRYAKPGEEVGGMSSPGPATGKASAVAIKNAQGNLVTLGLARQQLQAAKDQFDKLKNTLAAGGFGQGSIPTAEGQKFDKMVANLKPTFRKLNRTPGEGATSNVETALYNATLPSRGDYESTTEEQFNQLEDQINLLENGYKDMLSGTGVPTLNTQVTPASTPVANDFEQMLLQQGFKKK